MGIDGISVVLFAILCAISATTCRVIAVISGVEVQKGQMRARVRTFVLGTAFSQSYEFGHNKKGTLKIMH